MLSKNISYKTKQIVEFYSCNRHRWKEFYPSERWVFKKIAGENKSLGNVLDIGCACGGLRTALTEKFVLNSYTGVDIQNNAIDWARKEAKSAMPTFFIAGDIVKLKLNKYYDTVISLSCADWNIETKEIIDACWKRVKRGGNFILSLRLTTGDGINDIKRSYQYINFSGNEKEPEIANYVVFNFRKAIEMLKNLNSAPILIGAYGYWGMPSPTAVVPFERLAFAVFYIKKGTKHCDREIKCEFNLPIEFFL